MGTKYTCGQRFGKLVILERTNRKTGKNYVYKCKCDCGNVAFVSSSKLGRYTNSCGCIKRSRALELNKKNEENMNREQMQYFDGTQITQIKSKNPYSTNQTGIRGVYFEKRSGKFIAHITVRREKIVLGYFSNIEDAIKARKAAEEKYFEPLIDNYSKAQETGV